MKPNLYCYDGTGNDDSEHAVKLRVSDDEKAKFNALPRGQSDKSVIVTDLDTGNRWKVCRADCGLDCFCAASATPARAKKKGPRAK